MVAWISWTSTPSSAAGKSQFVRGADDVPLLNAAASHAGGRRFESCRAHHSNEPLAHFPGLCPATIMQSSIRWRFASFDEPPIFCHCLRVVTQRLLDQMRCNPVVRVAACPDRLSSSQTPSSVSASPASMRRPISAIASGLGRRPFCARPSQSSDPRSCRAVRAFAHLSRFLNATAYLKGF